MLDYNLIKRSNETLPWLPSYHTVFIYVHKISDIRFLSRHNSYQQFYSLIGPGLALGTIGKGSFGPLKNIKYKILIIRGPFQF